MSGHLTVVMGSDGKAQQVRFTSHGNSISFDSGRIIAVSNTS